MQQTNILLWYGIIGRYTTRKITNEQQTSNKRITTTNKEYNENKDNNENKLGTIVSSKPNEYKISISYLKNIENENIPEYAENYREEWTKFCYYWSEVGKSGKIRAETEKTFELKRRFATWMSRKKETITKQQIKFNSIG